MAGSTGGSEKSARKIFGITISSRFYQRSARQEFWENPNSRAAVLSAIGQAGSLGRRPVGVHPTYPTYWPGPTSFRLKCPTFRISRTRPESHDSKGLRRFFWKKFLAGQISRKISRIRHSFAGVPARNLGQRTTAGPHGVRPRPPVKTPCYQRLTYISSSPGRPRRGTYVRFPFGTVYSNGQLSTRLIRSTRATLNAILISQAD